jgi:hypothetical protein
MKWLVLSYFYPLRHICHLGKGSREEKGRQDNQELAAHAGRQSRFAGNR